MMKISLTGFSRDQKLISELERCCSVHALLVENFQKAFAVSLLRLPFHPLTQHFRRSEWWTKQRARLFELREKRHTSLSNVFKKIRSESTH